MSHRLVQAQKFVSTLLAHCRQLEFAAGFYNTNGKVPFAPRPFGRILGSLADLESALKWAGAMNTGPVKLPQYWHDATPTVQTRANIWIRPADSEHRWGFLDDLSQAEATRLASKLPAVLVQTSADHNYQAWVLLDTALSPDQRVEVNRDLARQYGADPYAVSEPRWGRMVGFCQTKPGKPPAWTNLTRDTTDENAPLPVSSSIPPRGGGVHSHSSRQLSVPSPKATACAVSAGGDDASRREFAFACHRLRAGWPPERIVEAIAQHALSRGKRGDSARARAYAKGTVENAMRAVARQ